MPTNTTKKTTRKAAATPTKKTPKQESSTPAATVAETLEKLFDAQPNPYHTPVPPYLWIDYPVASETLLGSEYVIRFGVGGADAVELSIDGSEWLPCRATSGYWWFDWSGITPGRHELVARMRTPEGTWYRTPVRACTYQA